MLCFENPPPLEYAFYRHFSSLVPAFHRQDNILDAFIYQTKGIKRFPVYNISNLYFSFFCDNKLFFSITLSYCK